MSTLGRFAYTLTWQPIPLTGRTGYYLTLNGTRVADVTANSFTFTNLTFSTTYTLGVQAHDGSGHTSVTVTTSVTTPGPPVPVAASSDGRSLIDQNGNPFLILADQLLPALHNASSLSDIYTVLADRASRGYNGIWMCLMPDAYIGAADTLVDFNGNQPFTGTAPSMNTPPTSGSGGTTVEAYWQNVDAVVQAAAYYGMTILMCPVETGGGAMTQARNWGNSGCNSYGQFLGARYKNSPNILWYHGNDFGLNSSWVGGTPPSQTDDTLMENVRSGIITAGATHLHTCELNYNLSLTTDDSSASGWRSVADCNQAYTYFHTYDVIYQGWQRLNSDGSAAGYAAKPIFMGESNYEGADNLATGFECSPYTLRLQNYWTVLAGGLAGQVWGNKVLHHFSNNWQSNLATPGAIQAGIWANFFRSIAWQKLVPEWNGSTHSLITAGAGTYTGGQTQGVNAISGSGATASSTAWATGALAADGSLAVVYIPYARSITVNLNAMRGPVTAQWFDPTTGAYTSIGSGLTGSTSFQASNQGLGNHASDTWNAGVTPPGTVTSPTVADYVLVLTA